MAEIPIPLPPDGPEQVPILPGGPGQSFPRPTGLIGKPPTPTPAKPRRLPDIAPATVQKAAITPPPADVSSDEDTESPTKDENEEDDQIDEAQFTDWVKQASQLPGERM